MRYFLSLAVICSFVGVANAAPNFVQDPNTGDNAWGQIGALSFEDDLIIDDGSYNINAITLYEFYGDGDTYTMNLYSDYTDNGGVLLNSWTVPNSGGSFDGNGRFAVTYNTSGLTLGPGTYIINFSAQSAAFGGDYYWYNADLDAVNGNNARIATIGGSDVFAGQNFDMSWNIDASPVPEPASMVALGLGVAAMIRRRRK